MNTGKLFGFIALAGLAGFIGGAIGSRTVLQAAAPQSVKASKFELVNAAGVTLATWEADPGKGAHLKFLPVAGHSAIEIGTLSDGRHLVEMAGRDGKRRIVLELDRFDKPVLGMGDERREGMVHVGYTEPDMPDPDWDNWGLSFRGLSERPIAVIGTFKTANGSEGLLSVSGRRIQ